MYCKSCFRDFPTLERIAISETQTGTLVRLMFACPQCQEPQALSLMADTLHEIMLVLGEYELEHMQPSTDGQDGIDGIPGYYDVGATNDPQGQLEP